MNYLWYHDDVRDYHSYFKFTCAWNIIEYFENGMLHLVFVE
jgi:hypothetical protein